MNKKLSHAVSAFFILMLLAYGFAEMSAQTLSYPVRPFKDESFNMFLDWGSYEREVLDSSRVRLIYQVDICVDSVENDRYVQDYVKLIGGDDYTKFQPLQKLTYDIIEAKGKLAPRFIDFKKEHFLFFYDAVLENLNDRTVTVTSRVCQDDFIYEEPSPQIDWIFTDEEKQIDGYNCGLVECDFRGRHYFVWYTQDILLPYGPWLFNGLPGLIISVSDKEGQYKFTFKGYDDKKDPILLCRYNYKTVSRKNLNKARSEMLRKPIVYMYYHLSKEKGWYISYQTYMKSKDTEYKYDTIELE